MHQGHFFEILKTNLFYLPQDILAVYFVLYVLFPKYLSDFKLSKFLFLLFLAILFLTSISIVVTFFILPKWNLHSSSVPIKEQFSNSLFALIGITGIAATIKYVRLNLINQFQTANISMKQMETELKYLRSQINPHFLFNSLNNIDELIYENQEKASKAIFHLSEILRYILKESEIKLVEVSKEIDFLNNYIDFIRLSFKDKEFIKCTILGDFEDRKIPPLLFLPVIENAVKYVDRRANSPGIDIKFHFNNDFIDFTCINQYSDMIESKNKNGIGLKNLRRRLELTYPNQHTFSINNANDEFIVDLKIEEK